MCRPEMDFKTIFSAQNNVSQEYYWSLLIEPGWTHASIWRVRNDTLQTISLGKLTGWQNQDFVDSVDAALASAIQSFPEDETEPSKTVFGVPAAWVEGSQIKKEHLERIKAVCEKLSLVPAGFVVTSEAVANLLKSQEGSPLSAILVGVGEEAYEITLFRYGKLQGTTQVAKSLSFQEDIKEGVARFSSGEALPSRVILYGGKKAALDELVSSLSEISWEDQDVKLLHEPKTEVVDSESRMKAISLAGASEILGADSLKTEELPEESEEDKSIVTPIDTKEEEETDIPKGQDDNHETGNVVPPSEELSAEDVGFTVGHDVLEISPQQKSVTEDEVVPEQKDRTQPLPVEIKQKGLLKQPMFERSSFSKVSSLVGAGSSLVKRLVFALVILLLIVVVGGGSAWYLLQKAQVAVYVSARKLEEPVVVTVSSTNDSLDFESGIVPSEVHETTVSGEKTVSTSGIKTVGEKAKGQITIRNGTSSPLDLDAGTAIFGANDLKFLLDEGASISAALSPANPGTATLGVTAADIGSQYNLAKDETFKVGNFPTSEVDAVTKEDFTGGSSREISAVSQSDVDSLLESLSQELKVSAVSDLSSAVDSNKMLLEETVSVENSNVDFSHKVGDEAENLKLQLETKASGLVVERSHLTELAKRQLQGKISSGFSLPDNNIKMTFKVLEREGGDAKLEMRVTGNLVPSVNPDEIASVISGKTPQATKEYLSTIPGFSRVVIKLQPSLPGPLGTLPRKHQNITIDIIAQD